MTIESAIHALAGTLILVSLALAVWVNPWWLLFTAFVGLNLLQSAFTHWCLAGKIFAKMGLKSSGSGCCGTDKT
jgi:hypothetical protein